MSYNSIKKLLENLLPQNFFLYLIKQWRKIYQKIENRKNKKYYLKLIIGAIADPKGIGHLNLLLESAQVPNQHKHLFNISQEQKIFIDCGVNIGKFSDIALLCNGKVYGFEPNPLAISLLQQKYLENDDIEIFPVAVSDKEGVVDFYINTKDNFDEGATLLKNLKDEIEPPIKHQVKTIDFTNFLEKNILSKHPKIYLLKIDVEGAELELLESIIKKQIYNKIEYIVCETHERFFNKEQQNRLEKIKKDIEDNNIDNIYLDWI